MLRNARLSAAAPALSPLLVPPTHAVRHKYAVQCGKSFTSLRADPPSSALYARSEAIRRARKNARVAAAEESLTGWTISAPHNGRERKSYTRQTGEFIRLSRGDCIPGGGNSRAWRLADKTDSSHHNLSPRCTRCSTASADLSSLLHSCNGTLGSVDYPLDGAARL